MGRLCGTFGCPLANAHRGLCQPRLGSGRKAQASRGRNGLSYFDKRRALPSPKIEKPTKRVLPKVGQDHQIAVPEWCSQCHESTDRGDVRLLLKESDVRAAMLAEKKAAEMWEIRMKAVHASLSPARKIASWTPLADSSSTMSPLRETRANATVDTPTPPGSRSMRSCLSPAAAARAANVISVVL